MDLAGFVGMLWVHAPPIVGSNPESRADFWRPFLLHLDAVHELSSSGGLFAGQLASLLAAPASNMTSVFAKAAATQLGTNMSPKEDLILRLLKLVDACLHPSGAIANFKRNLPLDFAKEHTCSLARALFRVEQQMAQGSIEAADAVKGVVLTVRKWVLSVFPWIAGLGCGVTAPTGVLMQAFDVCSRCTKQRAGAITRHNVMARVRLATGNAAGILAGCLVRQRPPTEEGCTWEDVRCCDHFQWSWCPGFEVTGNKKCRSLAHRHEPCPRYFARSTMWKHKDIDSAAAPGKGKKRGTKRQNSPRRASQRRRSTTDNASEDSSTMSEGPHSTASVPSTPGHAPGPLELPRRRRRGEGLSPRSDASHTQSRVGGGSSDLATQQPPPAVCGPAPSPLLPLTGDPFQN